MFKRLICASVLIAFIGFQLASSLKCWTCNSPYSCKTPYTVSCDYNAANSTRSALRTIMPRYPNTTSNRFECVNVTVARVSLQYPDAAIAGCAYRDAQTCKQQTNWPIYHCVSCTNDLCTKGPAGTFSSSLVTIVTSIVAVLLAKTLATS